MLGADVFLDFLFRHVYGSFCDIVGEEIQCIKVILFACMEALNVAGFSLDSFGTWAPRGCTF